MPDQEPDTSRQASDSDLDATPPPLSTFRQDRLTPPSPGDAPAKAIGPYTITSFHARGGLGEVFKARDARLRREVALKRIQHRFADQDKYRRRFLVEAEITARLQHPGIVPVYSMEIDDHGRPCYTMRFIEGVSFAEAIQRFHDRSRTHQERQGREEDTDDLVSLRDLAGTFIRSSAEYASLDFRNLLQRLIAVCQTVAYAHSRGVIHRDLKPANVMLGDYGETLVLDWGLAKDVSEQPTGAADSSGSASTGQFHTGSGTDLLTQAGQVMGTPAYMAPEQAAGDVERIGPAADVYALGVMLFQLLTGTVPFHGRTAKEILEQVQSQPPVTPRSLQPNVPKPLEAICLKAMARRIEDRYPSASALAEDLSRYLADEPVSAYREPVAVRLRRWARKRRTLVTTAVGVGIVAAISLVAGVILLNLKNLELTAAKDDAIAARDRARAVIEDMITDEMLDNLSRQQELTAKQRRFLESMLQYHRDLTQEAAVDEESLEAKAKTYFRMARVLQILSRHEACEQAFRQAVACYDRLAKADPARPDHRLNRARSQINLGILYKDLGRHDAAEAIYRDAMHTCRALVNEFPDEDRFRDYLARCYMNLANLLSKTGRNDEALASYQDGLKVYESLVKEFPAVTRYRQGLAKSYNNIGNHLQSMSRTGEAKVALEKAVAVIRKLVEANPAEATHRFELASAYNNLANVQADLGELEAAEASHRSALQLREWLASNFPALPSYAADLADTYTNLGTLLDRLGRTAEAEKAHKAAITLYEKLAREHPEVPVYRASLALSHSNLAIVYARSGRSAEAEKRFRQVLAIRKQLVEDFPMVKEYRHDVAVAYGNLALLLVRTDRYAEAEAAYRQAITVIETLAAESPDVPQYRSHLASTHNKLGNLFDDLGRADEMEEAYRTAVRLHEELVARFPDVPDFHYGLAVTQNNLGNALSKLGRLDEAEDRYNAAVSQYRQLVARSPSDPNYRSKLASTLANLGLLVAGRDRTSEAEVLYREALSIYQKLVANFPDNPSFQADEASVHNSLGVLFCDQKRYTEAAQSIRAAVTMYQELIAEQPETRSYQVDLGGAYGNYANAVTFTEGPAAALAWYNKAIAILEPVVARPDHLERADHYLRNACAGRARALSRLGRFRDAVDAWDQALKFSRDPIPSDVRDERAYCVVMAALAEPVAWPLLWGWPGF